MIGREPVPPEPRSRFPDRMVVVDAMAAVATTLLAVYSIRDPPGPVVPHAGWMAWLAACAAGLPVAMRRRWPMRMLAVNLGAVLVATLTGVVGPGVIWVSYIPTALVLYVVALTAPHVWSVGALAVSLLGAAAATGYFYSAVLPSVPPGPGAGEVPLFWRLETGLVAVTLGIPWVVGLLVGWRRRVAGRLAHQLAREAVAEERLRIARELHDIVGHSMSLIAVKATVANHIADARPAETRQALGVIEHTSRATLVEIRRLLGILRSESDTPADLAPPPGPAELPQLATAARAAGVQVELEVRGTDTLPEALGLSVYRIVQEALTNVVTHAAPATCHVTVVADDQAVRIDVSDDGRRRRATPTREGGGHGLIGMRERVAMYGGTFTAGPRSEGGFAVSAQLPYGPAKEAQ